MYIARLCAFNFLSNERLTSFGAHCQSEPRHTKGVAKMAWKSSQRGLHFFARLIIVNAVESRKFGIPIVEDL